MRKGKFMFMVLGVMLLLSACGQAQSKNGEQNVEKNIQDNAVDIEKKGRRQKSKFLRISTLGTLRIM